MDISYQFVLTLVLGNFIVVFLVWAHDFILKQVKGDGNE
jgi:hypothetical protein